MNGTAATSKKEVEALLRGLPKEVRADIWICPPVSLLSRCVDAFGETPVSWGAQDCHTEPKGAHTGDISAEMLADAGAVAVIVGHSERRSAHNETSKLVSKKAVAAHRAGMKAIICIGETAEQREQGKLLSILEEQLSHSLPESATGENSILAYEPVWAIGTGRVASAEEITEVHRFLRGLLDERDLTLPILYGGSLGPSNAEWLLRLENVDGGLIGTASLTAESFLGVIKACP